MEAFLMSVTRRVLFESRRRGDRSFADRLPLRAIQLGAAGLFAALGSVFVARALLG